jgi:O-antigen/teichoic acid export membrane protein
MLESLKRYRKFAIFNTPTALLNTVSWQVPSFMLAAFFSPTVVGYYAFGNQLLRVPMTLIGGSIAQAFYTHAAAANDEGTLPELVESTFRRLVEYSFVPTLALALISRELCVVMFGAQWAEAGVYTQILSLWMYFWFVSGPMARLFSVLERNELSFWLNVVNLIFRVISIWLGGILGSPRLALFFFSITGALMAGYVSVSIIIIAGVSGRRVGEILIKNALFFIPVGGVILLLKFFHAADWIQLCVTVAMVGCYFLYRFKDEIQMRSIIARTVRGAVRRG